jgi:hypothetical protein
MTITYNLLAARTGANSGILKQAAIELEMTITYNLLAARAGADSGILNVSSSTVELEMTITYNLLAAREGADSGVLLLAVRGGNTYNIQIACCKTQS